MKKRIIIMALLAAMALSLFCACGNSNKIIQQDDAQEIAVKAAGFSLKKVSDIHVHIADDNGMPCYSVHFNVNGQGYSYLISATGEVLSGGQQELDH